MSLPSGYKRLEYIQSSGTQFIDTGFKPNQNTRVLAEAYLVDSTNGFPSVFGTRSGSSLQFWAFWAPREKIFHGRYNTQVINVKSSPTDLDIYDFNKNTLTINGVKSQATAKTFTASNNLWVFGVNSSGSLQYGSSVRLYLFKIYDNGTLIRDFVPCINASGEVGLYDLVGKQFYRNAGTGTFTAGPVIAIAADESEITKLKYIQSSGKQYIKTGFVPNQDTRIVYDCYRETASAADHFFGVRTGNTTKNAFNFYIYNSGWRSGYNSTTTSVNGPSTGRYLIDKDKNVTYINGKTLGTATYASFTSGGEAYLFAMQNVGRGIAYGSHRLYSCQIYDNGTIVRDYIPAKLSDGTVGLYDKLNGLLYINAGTGTFISGGYALNLPVNIGGTWKNANEVFVNIGGTWKTVEAAFVNIGGTWKELG